MVHDVVNKTIAISDNLKAVAADCGSGANDILSIVMSLPIAQLNDLMHPAKILSDNFSNEVFQNTLLGDFTRAVLQKEESSELRIKVFGD